MHSLLLMFHLLGTFPRIGTFSSGALTEYCRIEKGIPLLFTGIYESLAHMVPKLPGYNDIESAHKDVHAHGIKAVKAYHAKTYQEGLKLLQDMETSSITVLNKLENLALSAESDKALLCTSHEKS